MPRTKEKVVLMTAERLEGMLAPAAIECAEFASISDARDFMREQELTGAYVVLRVIDRPVGAKTFHFVGPKPAQESQEGPSE